MGDPVCWLGATCLSCGRFLGEEHDGVQICPHCGAELPPPAPAAEPAPGVSRPQKSDRAGLDSGHATSEKEPPMGHANPSTDELRAVYRDARVIAVVGASGDPGKPAHHIPVYLQDQGYRVVPVNPGGGEILGEQAVDRLSAVDDPIDVVDVFRPSDETPQIAEEAVEVGAKVLWLQTGIASDEAAMIAGDGGLTVVMDACMGEMHRKVGLGPGPHAG